jgi:hypothetical protein
MNDDDNDARTFGHEDLRRCAMCERDVPSADGVYVGGGRWCCFPCAALLYSDDDEEGDDE